MSPAKTVRNHGEFQKHTLGGAYRAPDEVASAPGLLVPRARWSKLARRSLRPGACVCAVLQPLKDLLHPTAADLKQTHKLKRLVQAPNSFFMDVRCNQCISMYVPAWCACLPGVLACLVCLPIPTSRVARTRRLRARTSGALKHCTMCCSTAASASPPPWFLPLQHHRVQPRPDRGCVQRVRSFSWFRCVALG